MLKERPTTPVGIPQQRLNKERNPMSLTPTCLIGVVALTALCAADSTLSAHVQPGLEEIPALLNGKPLDNAPNDDELKRALKARYNERLILTRAHYTGYLRGTEMVAGTIESARRLLTAGMELSENSADRLKLLRQMREICVKLEAIMIANEIHTKKPLEISRVREFQLEITIEELRIKKTITKPK
jgi:hypothetical protein